MTHCEMTFEMFTKTYSINPIIVAIDIPLRNSPIRAWPSAVVRDRLKVSTFGEPYLRWAQKRHLHLTCNFLECIPELLQRRLLERQSCKVPLLPYEDHSKEFKASEWVLLSMFWSPAPSTDEYLPSWRLVHFLLAGRHHFENHLNHNFNEKSMDADLDDNDPLFTRPCGPEWWNYQFGVALIDILTHNWIRVEFFSYLYQGSPDNSSEN